MRNTRRVSPRWRPAWSNLVAQSGINAKTFKQLQMADIPNGDYRYIMCSKQVPDEVIAKLSKAIGARKPAVK